MFFALFFVVKSALCFLEKLLEVRWERLMGAACRLFELRYAVVKRFELAAATPE